MDYEDESSSTHTKKKVVISKTVIEDTRDFLVARSLRLPLHDDVEGLTSSDVITLAKGISHPIFKSWAECHEDTSLGFKVEYLHNNIVATELASTPHSEAIYAIVHQIASQDVLWTLQCPTEEDLPIPNREVIRPDVTVKPNGTHVNGPHLSQGRGYPTCIFEVGVSQSLPDLVNKLTEYYTALPTLQLYIAIKCYPTKGMLAIIFECANGWSPPTTIISFGLENLPLPCIQYLTRMQWQALAIGVGFGGAQCDQASLQLYRVSLPSHLVYAGRVGGIPAGAPASYFVDLYRVQQALAHT